MWSVRMQTMSPKKKQKFRQHMMHTIDITFTIQKSSFQEYYSTVLDTNPRSVHRQMIDADIQSTKFIPDILWLRVPSLYHHHQPVNQKMADDTHLESPSFRHLFPGNWIHVTRHHSDTQKPAWNPF